MVYETLDNTDFLNYLNHAKEVIESERQWEMLKKRDSSLTWVSGNDYTTAKALPTDFASPVKLYVGTDLRPFRVIAFEDALRFKDIYGRYYIDYQGSNYYLCGSTSATQTLNLTYVYQTDDLTLTTSPVWPARFHKLLAFYVAGLYMGAVDSDDINRLLAPNQKVEYLLAQRNMREWDSLLKANAMNFQGVEEALNADALSNVVY